KRKEKYRICEEFDSSVIYVVCYILTMICRKKFNVNLSTILRNYSVCRGLMEKCVYHDPRLLAASGSVIYQQLKAISGGGRHQERKNYYDILQLSPKATQAQVKKAYYNLSKTYHPDQYKGTEDASVKFREITEAYEVLGNFQKRKMYDKGFFNISPAATPAEAEQYAAKLYKSQRKKNSSPITMGHTPIFNFDEWSKAHYDFNRERREGAKIRHKIYQERKLARIERAKTDSVVALFLLGVIFYMLYMMRHNEYDTSKDKGK
ncbi:hypothetical protein OTU49_005312, partial [Cherax quadricarinatus]